LASPPKQTEIKAKKKSSRAELSLKRVNLERLHRQLLNVLSRETTALLHLSYYEKLDKDAAAALCNYLKLMKELSKMEEDKLSGLSDEELEKIANAAPKKA
jgi:hypothetical protein